MNNKTDLQNFSETASDTHDPAKFLLTELLKGFTVTERGLLWYYKDKTIHDIAGGEFELMLAQYLSADKKKAIGILYGIQ